VPVRRDFPGQDFPDRVKRLAAGKKGLAPEANYPARSSGMPEKYLRFAIIAYFFIYAGTMARQRTKVRMKSPILTT